MFYKKKYIILSFFISFCVFAKAQVDSVSYYKKQAKIVLKNESYDSAIYYSQKMRVYAVQKKDSSGILSSFSYWGNALQNKHQYVEAYKKYYKGYEIALKKNDSFEMSKMLRRISSVQNAIGEYNDAKQTAVKALELIHPEDYNNHSFKVYRNIGVSLSNRQQNQKAIDIYDKAIKYAKNFQDTLDILNNKGMAYLRNDKLDSATTLLKKASYSIRNDTTLLKNNVNILSNLGFALSKIGNPKSLEYLLLAENILKQDGKLSATLFASKIHLFEYYKIDDFETSVSYLLEALDIAKEIKSIDAEKEVLKYLIEYDVKNPNRKNYIKRNDSLSKVIEKSKNEYAYTKYEIENKTQELREEQLRQKAEIAKKDRNNWLLGIGLLFSIFGIIIYTYFYKRNLTQKKEIITLHKELHHRVKNNLSIIDAFIEVTKDEIQDIQSTERLSELQNRINSIYKVHEQLYKNDQVTHLYLDTYIKDIIENLQNSFPNNEHIAIHFDIQQGAILLPSHAIPIGIIINEFVTNSYKYAFDTAEKGVISIRFRESKNSHSLTLKDNGKGLPASFYIETSTTFGIRVMQLLSQQLQGKFILNGENGVHLTLNFPKE